MTRHDELRKHIEYQLLSITILKMDHKRKIDACKRMIANFQREIDSEDDYEIGEGGSDPTIQAGDGMRYPKLNDGESYKLNHIDNYLNFACCDCGLVHRIDFDNVTENTMEITLIANRRATAQLRYNHFGNLHKNNKWVLKRRKTNEASGG